MELVTASQATNNSKGKTRKDKNQRDKNLGIIEIRGIEAIKQRQKANVATRTSTLASSLQP
jgi:hypothetical protein